MSAKEIDLSDFLPERKGPPCTSGLAMEKLSGEDLDKVLAAMQASHVQHSMIAKRLNEWTGVKVTPTSVAKHRATPRQCSCR